MTTRTNSEAPRPEVLYLKTIFNRISSGSYRVPAFQRGYVWEENQILQLLESVYRGFPIGSALLWRVDSEQLRVDHSGDLPLPESSIEYPVSYLLDGLQRLTTLYACFHQHDHEDRRFFVVVDLSTESFLLVPKGEESAEQIRLSDLFDARRLLEAHQRLFKLENGEKLVERSIDFQTAFQEYMIPVVTIEDRSVPEVVEIFERVNSTGTRLSKVEFMRAVTWSEEFDLGPELDSIQAYAAGRGFDVPDETLVKLLGLGADLQPTSASLIELRSKLAGDLVAARGRTLSALDLAIEFFHDECILGYSYVPYEGQLLVVAGLMMSHHPLSADTRSRLSKWCRSVSLAEALRGKPDHYVARALAGFRLAASGRGQFPHVRVSVDASDLAVRRFTVGKALSAGIAALFASNEPLDLLSGLPIDRRSFMREFENAHFSPVLSKERLESALNQPTSSNRVVANMVVTTDLSSLASMSGAGSLVLQATPDSLASQFIPSEAVDALREGDDHAFVEHRSRAMYAAMRTYVATP